MSVKSTRIVVRSLPNGLGDYIGAVCDVVKVVNEENCGCPVYHLHGENDKYLAGFAARGISLHPDNADFPMPELAPPTVPIHEEAKETV